MPSDPPIGPRKPGWRPTNRPAARGPGFADPSPSLPEGPPIGCIRCAPADSGDPAAPLGAASPCGQSVVPPASAAPHGAPPRSLRLLISPLCSFFRLRLVAGLAISFACLWLLLHGLPVGDWLGVLSGLHPAWVLIAVLAAGAAVLVRGWRWGCLMRAAVPQVAAQACLGPYLAGSAVNNVLPARAGDLWRLLAVPGGARRILGTLALERGLDVAGVLCLGAVGVTVLGLAWWPIAMGMATIAVIGLGVTLGLAERWATPLRQRSRRSDRVGAICGVAAPVLAAMRDARRRRQLHPAIALTCIAWLVEGSAFAALAAGLGLCLGSAGAITTCAAATLTTMVPAAPGHVGTFHLGAATGAGWAGATAAQGTALALSIHAVLWITTTSMGLGWLAWSARRR